MSRSWLRSTGSTGQEIITGCQLNDPAANWRSQVTEMWMNGNRVYKDNAKYRIMLNGFLFCDFARRYAGFTWADTPTLESAGIGMWFGTQGSPNTFFPLWVGTSASSEKQWPSTVGVAGAWINNTQSVDNSPTTNRYLARFYSGDPVPSPGNVLTHWIDTGISQVNNFSLFGAMDYYITPSGHYSFDSKGTLDKYFYTNRRTTLAFPSTTMKTFGQQSILGVPIYAYRVGITSSSGVKYFRLRSRITTGAYADNSPGMTNVFTGTNVTNTPVDSDIFQVSTNTTQYVYWPMVMNNQAVCYLEVCEADGTPIEGYTVQNGTQVDLRVNNNPNPPPAQVPDMQWGPKAVNLTTGVRRGNISWPFTMNPGERFTFIPGSNQGSAKGVAPNPVITI